MKKIILPFVMSFVIFIIFDCSFATTAKVNVTAVRIRESASTDSNIIMNIYENDIVQILEENGEWYKVQYGEKIGYAKAEFFSKNAQSSANTSKTSAEEENTIVPNDSLEENSTNMANTNTVNMPESANQTNNQPTQEPTNSNVQDININETVQLANSINLRTIPNMGALEKIELPQGTNVTVEAVLGNWYKINSEKGTGWIIKSKMINQSENVTEPKVPEAESTENAQNVENTVVENEPKPIEDPVTNTNQQEQTPKQPVEETNNNVAKSGIVIVETARIRKSASSTSEIIGTLDEDDIVTIISEEDGFYKISANGISEGYISKKLVKEKDVSSRSNTEERKNEVSMEANEALNQSLSAGTSSSVTGADVVEFAKKYLGYPYVLGCSTPEAGFDCSGFTRYVFGHFGYALGQVAANQTSLGAVVERANLQTGDLILFYNDSKSKIGHCGIFMSGGDFIHSANPQRGVVIDNLNTNSYYSERFVTARRIAGTV